MITNQEKIEGPPYDGKPCPMCPSEIRNLSATVHNLIWRLEDFHNQSPCKIADKFQCMVEAAKSVERNKDWPVELMILHDVAMCAARCEKIEDLLKLTKIMRSVSDAVKKLSAAHFADRKHSHGDMPSLGRPIDQLKFKDGSTYGERKGTDIPIEVPHEPDCDCEVCFYIARQSGKPDPRGGRPR